MTTPTIEKRSIVERRELHAQRTGRTVTGGAFTPRQLWQSLPDALRKLDPRAQLRNPVMFVVWVGRCSSPGSRSHSRACSRG